MDSLFPQMPALNSDARIFFVPVPEASMSAQ